MHFHEFLRSRRSIRRFKPDAIPLVVIERLLTTAVTAPSAHNRQPWRFVVLTNSDKKAHLADFLAGKFRRDLEADGLTMNDIDVRVESSRARINSAPVAIVLCMDASEMNKYPDAARANAERLMAVQSTANAGLTLLLAAHAEGLGAVWNCAPLFAQQAVKDVLILPSTWEPQALIFIGRSDELPSTRSRKPVKSVSILE